jgi:hypothetical protein
MRQPRISPAGVVVVVAVAVASAVVVVARITGQRVITVRRRPLTART